MISTKESGSCSKSLGSFTSTVSESAGAFAQTETPQHEGDRSTRTGFGATLRSNRD